MLRVVQIALLMGLVLGSIPMALAHPGEPLAPHDLASAWNVALFPLLPLTVMCLMYVWGVQAVWQRAGVGHGISLRRCAAFAAAVLALIVALVSPLDALSEALFSAHMVQHLVLMLVAAPLLIQSELTWVVLWVLPRHWAQSLGRHWTRARGLRGVWAALSSPFIAGLVFGFTM